MIKKIICKLKLTLIRILCAAVFFLLISPVGLMGRLLGRDRLVLKKPNLDSYWIKRKPLGVDSDSFFKQLY